MLIKYSKITSSILLLFTILTLLQCKADDDLDYGQPLSPVNYQPELFPYENLSTYRLFQEHLKDQIPVYGVIPYEPIAALFTDYAHKKRFIWMPQGSKATYTADGEILDFPLGTILIKTFYYDSMTTGNTTQIIETRLMYKNEEGWQFANYIWNEAQTEATLDLSGENRNLSFTHKNQTMQVNYRIPNESECFTCHKINEQASPIGVKPQNLNKTYNYDGLQSNQLDYLKNIGYLGYFPSQINTIIDWEDTSKPLNERVRSYLDINCAHCHNEAGHCNYTLIKLAFSESNNPTNLGICIDNIQSINGTTKIVAPSNINRSALSVRVKSEQEDIKMPIIGRSIVHQEAAEMLDEWINSLTQNCN